MSSFQDRILLHSFTYMPETSPTHSAERVRDDPAVIRADFSTTYDSFFFPRESVSIKNGIFSTFFGASGRAVAQLERRNRGRRIVTVSFFIHYNNRRLVTYS